MEEFIPFGSREYLALLVLLFWARGMDFFSTWVATPNLVLEGNPIARRLRSAFQAARSNIRRALFPAGRSSEPESRSHRDSSSEQLSPRSF